MSMKMWMHVHTVELCVSMVLLKSALVVAVPRSMCDGLNVSANSAVVVSGNGTDFRPPTGNASLDSCCDACMQAGPEACEAFFTGPLFRLCVLYPKGSVIGIRSAPNHTAAFRGPIPSPAPAPSPRFPGGHLDQKLVILSQAEADQYGAKCLDGSPPAIYYSPAKGAENQNNWVLYFKGGGWCFDEAGCAQRSTDTLGTTTILPQYLNQTWDRDSGPLHPNSTLNPTFSQFHRVLLWYCDGASFAGNRVDPVVNSTGGKNVTMWFRGKAVLNALLSKLKNDYGLGQAKQVLLTGCSAGGMSTYLHADYVRETLAWDGLVRYKAAALSGFFLDHATVTGIPKARSNYDYMFKMQNMSAGVNQNCLRNTHPTNCSTPQQNYGYTQSPFFVMNSMLDAYQMANIFDIGCSSPESCNSTQIHEMDTYQHDFYTAISSFPTFAKQGNGAFLYNCVLHCGEQNYEGFNQIAAPLVDSTTRTVMRDALSKWWNADESDPASAHTYIESCILTEKSACNPTCPSHTLGYEYLNK